MKIVINRCYGGFGLSEAAELRLKQKMREYKSIYELKRNDPVLVSVIEELGATANDRFAKLKVIEIPDDVEWEIQEYDGVEWVAEKHRTWN